MAVCLGVAVCLLSISDPAFGRERADTSASSGDVRFTRGGIATVHPPVYTRRPAPCPSADPDPDSHLHACVDVGGEYDFQERKCRCYKYFWTKGYYSGPRKYDVILLNTGSNPGPASFIQTAAFGHGVKTHAQICSNYYNGQCQEVWENQVIGTVESLLGNPEKCSDLKKIPAYRFAELDPGIRLAEPGRESYGTADYFRPTSLSIGQAFERNRWRFLGQPYRIGGWTVYHPYSSCSESVSDVMELNPSEGAKTVHLSKTEVEQIVSAAIPKIYNLCRDMLKENGAWLCNKKRICTKLSYKVLNAFLDQPSRNDRYPNARKVEGVTSPEGLYQAMSGERQLFQTLGTTGELHEGYWELSDDDEVGFSAQGDR